MIFGVLAVACLATSSLAQICCTPAQWEATKTILENGQHNDIKRTVQTVSYDAENNRTSVTQNITSFFGQEKRLQVISDFATMKKYVIYLDDKTCFTEDIFGWFQPTCIKETDSLLSAGVIGVGDNTISTSTYLQHSFFSHSEMTVTEECVPVIQTKFHGTFKDKFETTMYTDVTSGIVDIDIFTPPAYCDLTSLMKTVLFNRGRFDKL